MSAMVMPMLYGGDFQISRWPVSKLKRHSDFQSLSFYVDGTDQDDEKHDHPHTDATIDNSTHDNRIPQIETCHRRDAAICPKSSEKREEKREPTDKAQPDQDVVSARMRS